VTDTDAASGVGRYGVKGVVPANEYKKIYQVRALCDAVCGIIDGEVWTWQCCGGCMDGSGVGID
jgi:hypothetical protein